MADPAPAHPFLTGNFAPVEGELDANDLAVTGRIPEAIEGVFARIGPNPIDPDPARYHWFLGSGMVHGVWIGGGRAHRYRRRFVRDDHVVARLGGPPVPGPRRDPDIGSGVANTHVIRHAGRILALVEAGNLPVELDDELETVARTDFEGTLRGSFSAHPKRDPRTGELWAATYTPFAEEIGVVVVGTDGRVRRSFGVPVPGRPMVHDCAITEHFLVLFDLPVTLDPTGGSGLPYRWHPEYGARVGLLPREGSAEEVLWAEVEPCFVFHPMNAFEDEGGRVVVDLVRHPRMFDRELRGPSEGSPTLERWTVDPRGGPVKEERLDDRGQEFPRIDERRTGRIHRFGYGTAVGEGLAFGALLKHDLVRGTGEIHHEGPHRAFSEPVFVPAHADAEEDEGFVLATVFDAGSGRSEVVVLDARNFTDEPLARIHLPDRVPFGFHGSFLPAVG